MSAFSRLLAPVLCAFIVLVSIPGHAQQLATTTTPPASTNAAPSALTTPTVAAQRMIADAVKRMNANDVEGALSALNQAIQMNPNSTGALVLRASIYCQKKLWSQAEDDFKAAAKIAPTNSVLKFNLVEVKFMQKQYDQARPGFLALETDPDMGDFASYKVFLCDLFGGHEAAAKKDLDVFNDVMGNPSYYFGNAAWDLVHKDLDGGRDWLLSASRIYPPQKFSYYAQSLRDLGYLPIPEPGDKVTPPSASAPAPAPH